MPISGTGRSRGFTLVELLVVLTVLALMATAVTLGGGFDTRLAAREEGERLRLALERALLDGLWGNRRLGWSYDAQGYRFWQADPQAGAEHWLPLDEEGPFHGRAYLEQFQVLAAEQEGQPIAPGQVLLLQSQAPPLFTVVLRAAGERSLLRSTPTGQVLRETGGGG